MEYAIFLVIKGRTHQLQKKLIRDVGPRFEENYMIHNPLPLHITLKYPFKTNKGKSLEKSVKEFAKTQKQTKIKAVGFGSFHKHVIFTKLEFSKQALLVRKKLLNQTKELGIKPDKLDFPFKPHMTVAYGNTKESFSQMWEYVQTLKKPHFNIMFDNISIMRNLNKKWQIYRAFKIK